MNKVVFLDRDGTINIDKHYLHKIEEFEFLPGAVEGMKKLQDLGYLLVIITNQSGIARGYYSEKQYKELEQWMIEELRSRGVYISGTYYCPHLPNASIKEYAIFCECRKPRLGLFEKAIQEHNIDVKHSIAIGDKNRDLEICKNGMTRGFLVYSKQKTQGKITCIEGGILEVAEIIAKEEKRELIKDGLEEKKRLLQEIEECGYTKKVEDKLLTFYII